MPLHNKRHRKENPNQSKAGCWCAMVAKFRHKFISHRISYIPVTKSPPPVRAGVLGGAYAGHGAPHACTPWYAYATVLGGGGGVKDE